MSKKLLVMVIIILSVMPFYPEEMKNLDLDVNTSIAMALKNNLNIIRENISLEKYTWAMATSWNRFIPEASLGFSMTHLDDQAVTKKYPQLLVDDSLQHVKISDDVSIYSQVIDPTIPSWSVGMSFQISYNLNAASEFSVYQTVLDWKSGKLSLETAEKKLKRDVKKTYYSLIILKNTMEIINEKMDTVKKSYDQAIINRQNGISTKVDELKAKSDYENIKPEYMDMENAFKQAMLNFKQMIGLKDDVEPVLTSGMPDIVEYNLDYQDLLNRYMDRKLEIQSLSLALDNLRNVRNMGIAGITPSFFISYIYDPIYLKDPVKNSNWFSDVNNDWVERTGALTLGFSIPLSAMFAFSREQMKIVNNEFTIRDTFKALEQLRLDTKRQIQSIVLNMKKSLKSIETLKTNIELSQEVYSMTYEAYKAGTKKLLDVEDAENGLNGAKLNLLKQQYEYISNLLDLEYSLNVSIEDIVKDKAKAETN